MFGVSNVGVIPTKVPAAAAPAGQIVFNTSGTTNWTVPTGVTSICCVCIQANGNAAATTVAVASIVVCQALNGSRIGDGGGGGGVPGTRVFVSGYWYGGGAGGAGGYGGNGGNGGTTSGAGATSGSGGGGGGGSGGVGPGGPGRAGGGTGLLGQGANGAAGSSGAAGLPGSNGSGTLYGGGLAGTGTASGLGGGALAYKNNVAVTPGSTVVISIGASNGAVRIIWGAGRAYPSTNTGDV